MTVEDEQILRQIDRQIDDTQAMTISEIIDDIATGENAELFSKWNKTFGMYSVDNSALAHFSLHTIIGQMLLPLPLYINAQKNDLRIHLLHQQDSGSGKSTSENFIIPVTNKIGIPIDTMSGDISDVALVGGYDYDERGNILRTTGKLEKFKDGGILLWDEVKYLMNSLRKEWSSSQIPYLTSAMNSFWSESNKIKRELKASTMVPEDKQINYHCKTSFMYFTFPIALDLETFVNSGFIQRTIPFYRRLTEPDWNNMTNKVNDAILSSQTVDRVKIENVVRLNTDEVIAILKAKRNFKYSEFGFDVGVKSETEKFISELTGLIKGISLADKNIFNTFRIRSLVTMYKFALHYAWSKAKPGERKINVDPECISYASEMVKNIFKNFLEYLDWSYYGMVESVALKRYSILARNMKVLGNLPTHTIENEFDKKVTVWASEDFIKVISALFKISEGTTRNLLTEWEGMHLVTRYKAKGREKSYITM